LGFLPNRLFGFSENEVFLGEEKKAIRALADLCENELVLNEACAKSANEWNVLIIQAREFVQTTPFPDDFMK